MEWTMNQAMPKIVRRFDNFAELRCFLRQGVNPKSRCVCGHSKERHRSYGCVASSCDCMRWRER